MLNGYYIETNERYLGEIPSTSYLWEVEKKCLVRKFRDFNYI